MIYSMTAFSRSVEQKDWGSAVWEIRAVNHRYLDCSFKMPENFRHLEMKLREILREKIQRGRIECTLQYKPLLQNYSSFSIDKNLVQNLAYAVNEIKKYIPEIKAVNPLQLLAWPNVLRAEEENIAVIHDLIIHLFTKALNELIVARTREGDALQKVLEQKLKYIVNQEKKIRERIPNILQLQRAKIIARLEDVKLELDPQRFEQELVLLAHKIDIIEELDRLAIHIKEMQRILQNGGYVGKRLDFLMQEFNREINTIAAKSIDTEITSVTVELKVIIEQIREQIQNIE